MRGQAVRRRQRQRHDAACCVQAHVRGKLSRSNTGLLGGSRRSLLEDLEAQKGPRYGSPYPYPYPYP